MEGSNNSLGSGSGLATSGAKPGMQHGSSSKAKSLTSKPARGSADAGTVEASLGATKDLIGIHHPPPPPPPPPLQLVTSGADTEAPHVVLSGRGAGGGGAAASSSTPVTGDMPVAARSGMYSSSRRQGGAAASVGARPTLPRSGASSAAMPAVYGGGEDVNGESLASNTGYSYNRYYGSDQTNYFSSSTYGYNNNNQGEYPGGGGGSSGSTSMPYGSIPGPVVGSSSSGPGASDGQSMPVYSFPYHSSSSAPANLQQCPNQHSTQYQQPQRQHQLQQHSPCSPQIPTVEQGGSAYQGYYQQTYQPQQPQMQLQQRSLHFQAASSTSQSTGREGQYYGYCYGSSPGQRRSHARTASSSSGAHYYNPQQQQGCPPPSSYEGETLYNQGGTVQSSSQGGTTEGCYQQYAQCASYSYQSPSPSAQQQHSPYIGGEGQTFSISASYGCTLLGANKSSQPCSTTASAYGGESDVIQGASPALYSSGAYAQADSAGSTMNGSEVRVVGGRGYGASAATAAVGSGGSGVGCGSAIGGYYGTGYAGGCSAPVLHASRTQDVPYTDTGSDTVGMPLGPVSGKSGQAAASGSYPYPQQGNVADVEDGGQSYHGYAANGYRDYYYAAANQIGGCEISPGYGYTAGHTSSQQSPMSYQTSFGCGEAQPVSSATASPLIAENHQRGSGGPPQPQQPQYQRRSSFCALDPRYGGGGDGNGGSYDAYGYALQHPQQQGYYRGYSNPSQPQNRVDARSSGASLPVIRHSQCMQQQPETVTRRYNAAEEQGKCGIAEQITKTQAPDDTVPMPSVRGRGPSRSSSSGGHGHGDGGVGGSVVPTPSRKRGKKGMGSGTAHAHSAADTEAARKAAENSEGREACGQRSATLSTTVLPASAKDAECQRQASLQQTDAPILEETLGAREPLVSLELPPSSVNAPRRQQPPLRHTGEGSTTGKSGGVPKGEVRSQQAADLCVPHKGGTDAATPDGGEFSMTGVKGNVDEEAKADHAAVTFKDGSCGTATPAMAAIRMDHHGSSTASGGSCGQRRHSSSSTEFTAAHASPVSHGSGSGSGAQSFLRRSPLTPCLSAPFHTYICGAIVEQAAQLQANACSSSATGGRTGIDAASAGTPSVPLSTGSSQALPAMYTPVQRLLSREVSRGAHSVAAERKRRLAQASNDSGCGDEEGACAYGEEDVEYARDGAEAPEAASEGSKGEGAEGGLESVRDLGSMQSATTLLTADALAAVREAPNTTASLPPPGTTLTDNSLRSSGGRPHHMHLLAHHHSHHMRRSTPASEVSSPSAPALHHCRIYHSISPFLQPASLAASCTASLMAGGSAATNKYVQSPESASSAALPPRLPSGGGGSTPHLHRVGDGSREGSGAAATMQPQQLHMGSYPYQYNNQASIDLDGGRCAVVPEGGSGGAEELLHYSYQGNISGGCNTTKPLLRQSPLQNPGTEDGTIDRCVGPGGALLTTSPATVVHSTFFNTLNQSSPPPSIGATARPGSSTPSPTSQHQHHHQRAANSGGASRFATSPDCASQQGGTSGPGNNMSNTYGSSHHVNSLAHHRYPSPTHPNGYFTGGSQINLQAGGHYPMLGARPPYIYEYHVGQELLLEEFHAAMRFNAATFGNIACLVDAFSPQVPVASNLEFPCNEEQCQLICTRSSRGLSSPPGGDSSQHGSAPGSRSSPGGTLPVLLKEDARAIGGAGHNGTSGSGGAQKGPVLPAPRPAHADRTRYWDFSGFSYCEPVVTLKSIWQSFDNPFGCVVNLAEPIYPAPMRPAEGELVYTPLLSGFRIRFHPASSAYKRLAALREVRRQRHREEAAAGEGAGASTMDERAATSVEGAARGGSSYHATGPYAEEDGVLKWSATDRPNNRNIIVEQIVELAKCDESYAELLTATTADVDHQSWVALMWQPVFCGGHSSKYSCGTFLAYYLLRAPRHLFIPFAYKSEGAAMNSSWSSPVFRGDRAALSFDLWSLQRHYHIARWVSPPPMTHIMATLSVDGEDDEADNTTSSCASTSRGRNSWEEGQTGCASNRTTESFGFSTNGDSRVRLRDVYAGSASVGGGIDLHATTGTTNAATCPATAKTTYVRIPLVGLIPNRCRSEVWFKPMYDASLMGMRQHCGGGGGVMGGGDGAGAGVSGGGVGMGSSNGFGGAGSGGSGVGGNAGNSGDHAGLYAFYAPLFLIVTALQLMCWDAYNEWEHKSPTLTATAARPSTFSEARRDAEDPEVAVDGTAGAAGTPSSSFSNPLPAMMEETMSTAQRPQQQSDYDLEAATTAGTGGGNPTRGAVAHRRNLWPSYVTKGVELMTDAARQYRTVREVANLDAAVDESAGGSALVGNNNGGFAAANEAGISSAEEKRPGEGDKSVAKQQRVGCAIVAGGTSSAMCDPVARVIAGLLDYYQWAQYDTSLTALATAYCAT
nr:unnamed protein product [Leishmania braziliensis]